MNMRTHLKHFLEQVVPSVLLRPLLSWKYNAKLRDRAGKPAAAVFTDIYKKNAWSGQESVSGRGSDPAHTRSVTQQLPQVLRQLGVKSILDVPCGDFAWMQHVDLAGFPKHLDELRSSGRVGDPSPHGHREHLLT